MIFFNIYSYKSNYSLWKTKRVHQEQKGCFVNAFCLKRQVQKLDIVYTDAAHLNNKIIFIFVVCSNDGFFFFWGFFFKMAKRFSYYNHGSLTSKKAQGLWVSETKSRSTDVILPPGAFI